MVLAWLVAKVQVITKARSPTWGAVAAFSTAPGLRLVNAVRFFAGASAAGASLPSPSLPMGRLLASISARRSAASFFRRATMSACWAATLFSSAKSFDKSYNAWAVRTGSPLRLVGSRRKSFHCPWRMASSFWPALKYKCVSRTGAALEFASNGPRSRPSRIRSFGSSAPKTLAKVGSTSMLPAIRSHVVPAGIRPGQRMIQGSRTPPSRLVPLLPENGGAGRPAGPLSEVKITRVFSSKFCSRSAAMIWPTDQSISSMASPMAPWALLPLKPSDDANGS